MRKFLLSLLLFSTAFGLMAQQRTIRGVVSDENETLPFASVLVKGTTRGVATDINGKYEVSVSNGETLVFSFSGMTTQEFKIAASTPATLNVKMKSETTELEIVEVVAVGYGVVRKTDLTGSLSSMGEEQMRKAGPAISIESSLAGRVAGVTVNNSSGQPGEANSVNIRGTSSFGNNQPLYVVDGMPIGSGVQGGGSNPLASINPADIVSMEILKDASATAIYGSRAANGVVMITTRRGGDGNTKISYDGSFLVSQVAKKLEMMNLREYAAYVTDDEFVGPALNIKPTDKAELRVDPSFLGRGTDWQDELFRIATGQSHQLSITGGNKETQFAMSLGLQNQDGVMIGSDFQRFNGRINLENQTKSWLKTGMTIAYTRISQTKQPGFESVNNANSIDAGLVTDETPLMQALISLPTTSVRDVNGNFYEVSTAEENRQLNTMRLQVL